MPGVQAPGRYQFGGLEFDPRSGEIFKAGARVRLPHQPALVLTALLERAGDVVTREELRARIWPAHTFVDFEHGLNAAVNRIREVLGDAAHHPRLIETLPRRGYRVMVPVDRAAPAGTLGPPSVPSPAPFSPASAGTAPPTPAPSDDNTRRWWSRSATLATVLGLLALAMSSLALWLVLNSRGTSTSRELPSSTPPSSAAREACDKGWQQLAYGSRRGFAAGIEYFERAIALDPGLASAHAGLAEGQALAVWNLYDAPDARRDAALAAAARARALASPLVEVERASALTAWIFEWDWAAAQAAFQRALDIGPHDARTLRVYCTFLAYSGREPEALGCARREVEGDPLALDGASDLAAALLGLQRPAEALNVLRRLDERGLDTPRLQAFKAASLASAGDCDGAAPVIGRVLSLAGGDADDQVMLVIVGWAAARCGERSRALTVLERLREMSTRHWVDPGATALVHAGLGDRDAALTLLGQAVDARAPSALSMAHDPMLASLRGDPRFAALVRRTGAPGRQD
ncbi:MAG: winged helix-turn-helix domain-containing protein [Vicinamibacteraceae bacterium]|nr:winged helix-turn-helix domain-containing protein [Vicinamibacteraceae bacterium]